MNLLIFLPRYGLNCTTTGHLQVWLWYYITHEDWYAIKHRNQLKLFNSGWYKQDAKECLPILFYEKVDLKKLLGISFLTPRLL